MAARRPEAEPSEAFEAHLRALARALDVQVGLVRSALALHPASSLVDAKKLVEVDVAIGGLRSDLLVATAAAGSEALASKADPRSTTTAAPFADLDPTPRSQYSRRSSGESHVSHDVSGEGSDRPANFNRTMSSRLPVWLASDCEESADECDWSETMDAAYLMRARGSVIGERQASSPCVGGVLNPVWPPRQAWDLAVLFVILCDCVVLPFQLAEFHAEPGLDDFWLWFTVGIFSCDLVMNFFTGYFAGKNDEHRQEGALVTEKVGVAMHYIRGWFWIDFLSTVPWTVIVDLLQPSSERDASSAGQLTKLTKVIKLTRLLRLLRMLRLCKLSVIWERLEGQIGSITVLNVVSMLKVLGTWTAICHWGACVWWMVGKADSLVMLITMQSDESSGLHWTELPRVHSADDDFGQWRWVDRPASEQYVFCFYWILGVMRTMPAEVTPVNLTERVFVLLFMFFAVMAFAINVSRFTQAWFRFGARKDAFKEEMACVRMHLRAINCGDALQLRTQTYLSHLFERRKLHAKELGLLSTLPEGLKRKLSQTHRIHYLRMIPRLRNWIDSALQQVCDATEAVDCMPGDKITEKDHDAEAAYVLMRGGLQVYFPSRASDRRASQTSGTRSMEMFSQLSWSSSRSNSRLTIVDEHCLFEWRRTAQSQDTVVVLECSEVLRVDRRRFQEVVRSLHARHAQALKHRREAELQQLRRSVDTVDTVRSGSSLAVPASCDHFSRQSSPIALGSSCDYLSRQSSLTALAAGTGSEAQGMAGESQAQSPKDSKLGSGSMRRQGSSPRVAGVGAWHHFIASTAAAG